MSEFIVVHWVDRDAAYRDGRYWPLLTNDDCTIDLRFVELAAVHSDGTWREVWVTDVIGPQATAPAEYADFLAEYAVTADGLATRRDGNDPAEDRVSVPTKARRPESPAAATGALISETPDGLVLDLSTLDAKATAGLIGLSGSPAAVVGTGDGSVTAVSVFLDPSKAVERWYAEAAEAIADPRLTHAMASEARGFLGAGASGVDFDDMSVWLSSPRACLHQSGGLFSFVVGQAEMVLS